jgi:hypothetical protein
LSSIKISLLLFFYFNLTYNILLIIFFTYIISFIIFFIPGFIFTLLFEYDDLRLTLGEIREAKINSLIRKF